MAWVYILKGRRYYVGSTPTLINRLKDHRRGNTHTTKRIGNWRLVWQKEFFTIKEARNAEFKIKKWKSSKMIDFLINEKISL